MDKNELTDYFKVALFFNDGLKRKDIKRFEVFSDEIILKGYRIYLYAKKIYHEVPPQKVVKKRDIIDQIK